MHTDLLDCIASSRLARDAILAKSMTVKEANSVASNNHIIVVAHSLDLRERMFLADYHESQPTPVNVIEATPEPSPKPDQPKPPASKGRKG
jgi:hypothetical protein